MFHLLSYGLAKAIGPPDSGHSQSGHSQSGRSQSGHPHSRPLDSLQLDSLQLDSGQLESRVIILRDQSSSMAWIPEFPTIWNEQILELGKLAPTLRVTIYSVNLEMEKVCDRIPLPAVPPLEKSRWHYGNDGVLKGGSPLVDAVIRGCQKAQQYRRRGFAGPIGLFLFTDGWSKNDINAPREAEKWLAHARSELGITFRMFGFLHKYNKAMLSVFSQEIGLRPEEDQMMAFNQHPTREQTVRNSLEKFKEEIQSTICESLDAPLPQLNR